MKGFFIIIFFIFCKLQSFGQIRTAEVDSLNLLIQSKKTVSLKKFGEARIELKNGTVFLKCVIIEVHPSYVVYLKRNTLHDQEIDKIEQIRFENIPWIVQLNEKKIFQIQFKSNY